MASEPKHCWISRQLLTEIAAGKYGPSVRRPGSATPEVAQRQLGLLIPGLGTTEIFEVICGELAGLARVHDYGLLWGGGHSRPQEGVGVADAEGLCEQFIRNRVDGVFFAPFEH